MTKQTDTGNIDMYFDHLVAALCCEPRAFLSQPSLEKETLTSPPIPLPLFHFYFSFFGLHFLEILLADTTSTFSMVHLF